MRSTPSLFTPGDCLPAIESDVYCYGVYICDGLEEQKEHSLDHCIRFPAVYDSLPRLSFPLVTSKAASSEPLFPVHHPIATSRLGTTSRRVRALTGLSSTLDGEMMTSVQAPGSPPELTSSKSSKSSSFHSSSFSGADGIASDLSHFEDIGLEDERPSTVEDLYGHNRSNLSRPSSFRKTSATMNGNKGNTTVVSAPRELVNGTNRPTYPSLYGQVRSAVGYNTSQSLILPNGQGLRKSIVSPSAPSLAITAMRNRSRSRSPSPTHPQSIPPSPRSLPGGANLRPRGSPIIRRSTSRTGSWQPSRKTAREIEDEYHDSDEDLPDDASLWNVPLSPALYRTTSTAASSANPSPSTSPERPSHFCRPQGMDQKATRPIHTAPAGHQPFRDSLASVPASPNKPGLPRGSSTGMMPDHFGFPKTRAKSWTVAIAELSEEAKSLSEALEAHAFETDRQIEERLQNGEPVVKPYPGKLARSRTSVIELPPLRKSEVMVDPLPVSKEKEKVLSRTRPSWLPPKNRKEEKKHLKEYQRMMEMSLEAGKAPLDRIFMFLLMSTVDKKKAVKAASIQCVRDDTKATLLRIWEEHVLPNWDQAVREPRTRELWWRGIAPHSRAEVWKRAIGNELALTESTYTKALQRAKAAEKEIQGQRSGDERKEKVWFAAIRRDVDATFPDLKLFQLGRPLYGALTDLLMAYTMYRSDVGYSHCTHLPAALLLINVDTAALAFTLLANLLNRPLPLAFLTGDSAGTTRTYELTLNLLAAKFPKLHTHLFTHLAISPAEIFEPMIRSLFLRGSYSSDFDSSNMPLSPLSVVSPSSAIGYTGPGGLSLELASRVWDVMVFDGDAMVIRTCVAILGCLEIGLYGSREDVLQVLGWEGTMGGDSLAETGEDAFMDVVRGVGKEGKNGEASR
ncbi:hypothetical protein MMC18_003991 [Xylographa bjoerkii]|nr:hypothetical protein [Xylographa bjoerkii]